MVAARRCTGGGGGRTNASVQHKRGASTRKRMSRAPSPTARGVSTQQTRGERGRAAVAKHDGVGVCGEHMGSASERAADVHAQL